MMISVGSRDENGRFCEGKGKGLGFGGEEEMEGSELEEGEAYNYNENNNLDAYDPLGKLSYIEEKLQNVLGHLQKDFEGEVSAEYLGAKFGGYGSFLPTYQRSPSIFAAHCRSPPIPQGGNPPNGAEQTAEGSRRSLPQQASAPVPSRVQPDPPVQSFSKTSATDGSTKKEPRTSEPTCNAVELFPKHEPAVKPLNGSNKKSLKVRIKVASENPAVKAKAELYSGLGLDISPTSSLEGSSDESGGLSPETRESDDESPAIILQIMTSFEVPGGSLLSPLSNILQRFGTERKKPLLKETKSGAPQKSITNSNTVEWTTVFTSENLNGKAMKGLKGKKGKSFEKNERVVEVKHSNDEIDGKGISSILCKEVDIETPEGREVVSNALKIPLLAASKDAHENIGRFNEADSWKDASYSNSSLKERSRNMEKPLKDLVEEQVQDVKADLDVYVTGRSYEESLPAKGKITLKANSAQKPLEEKLSAYKEFTLESKKELKGKADALGTIPKDASVKKELDIIAELAKPKAAPSAAPTELMHGEENLTSGGKKRSKDSHCSKKVMSDSSRERPTSASGDKRRSLHEKDYYQEANFGTGKLQKEQSRATERDYSKDSLRERKVEYVENRVNSFENSHKEKFKVPKIENGPSDSFDRLNERLDVRNIDTTSKSQVHGEAVAIIPPGVTSEVAAVPPAPVVIYENWVQCDACEKWRLHPHGQDAQLPEKWNCSMQTWLLPEGSNICEISEEESNKVFNAKFLVHGHHNNPTNENELAVSGVTLADVPHGVQGLRMPFQGKKKNISKTARSGPRSSTPSFLPSTSEKAQQTSVKSKSLQDVNLYPPDINPLSRGALQPAYNGRNHIFENGRHKHKEKRKSTDRSDRDDYIKHEKQSKSKSKRPTHHESHQSSKKNKSNCLVYTDENWHLKSEVEGNDPLMKSSRKKSHYNDQSLVKESKFNQKVDNDVFGKKIGNQGQPSLNDEIRTSVLGVSDSKLNNSEVLTKKRKLKDWQDKQYLSEASGTKGLLLDERDSLRDEEHEREHRKEKRAKTSKVEGKESIIVNHDERREKRSKLSHGSSDSDRGNITEREPLPPKLGEGVDLMKKDPGFAQSSTAANSSSSKVSGSNKIKPSCQEVKGSPVESVSSSPLRTHVDKVSSIKNNSDKEDAAGLGLSAAGSPRRCSDSEIDVGNDQSSVLWKEKSPFVEHVLHDTDGVSRKPEDNQSEYPKRSMPPVSHGASDDPNTRASVADYKNGLPNGGRLERQSRDVTGDRDKDIGMDGIKNANFEDNSYQDDRPGKGASSRSREKRCDSRPNSVKRKKDFADLFGDGRDEYGYPKNSNYQYESGNEAHLSSPYCEKPLTGRDNYTKKSADTNDAAKHVCESRKEMRSKSADRGDLKLHHSGLPLKHQLNDISNGGKLNGHKDRKHDKQNPQKFVAAEVDIHTPPGRADGAELVSEKGKLKSSVPIHAKQEQGLMTSFRKGDRGDPAAAATDNDTSKVLKHSRKPEMPNGVHNGSLRHNLVNGITAKEIDSRSPSRKENGQAALREAKDLKHSADRLKNSGGEACESTGLYFRAALKFLHGASLLEPYNAEGAKHGDTTQSMHLYIETAKLCEFCAHEYERHKDMAPAALAYKCMEVAYMRVIYWKHTCANRDRHELQAALPTALPGESPSSSASDVDNLNNHGMLDKALMAKGVGSPQILSGVVINSRTRPCFDRLLNLAQDVCSAMDALKKWQHAFAVANGSTEGSDYGPEGISSVRKVLDFNFHDVEGLLRLVRLALEAISR